LRGVTAQQRHRTSLRRLHWGRANASLSNRLGARHLRLRSESLWTMIGAILSYCARVTQTGSAHGAHDAQSAKRRVGPFAQCKSRLVQSHNSDHCALDQLACRARAARVVLSLLPRFEMGGALGFGSARTRETDATPNCVSQ
jgi:hypothetical protein